MSERRRRWKSIIGATAMIALLTFVLVEILTRVWLARFASADQLRVFGTLEENRAPLERAARNSAPASDLKAGKDKGLQNDAVIGGVMYAPHRYIGYVPAPNLQRGANRHNQWGYRGEDFPRAKPKGEYRIAILGGSTTYTSAVEDYRNSIPDLLQSILHERGLPEVRVINSGVPGWTSYETLSNYQFRLVETDPDLILIYDGINDVAARMVFPYRFYRADNSGYQVSDAIPPSMPLHAHSAFVRVCLIALGRMDSPMALHNVYGRLAPSSQWWAYRGQDAGGTYPSGVFAKQPLKKILESNPPIFFQQNYEHLIASAQHDGHEVGIFTFKISKQTSTFLNRQEFYDAIAEQNDLLKVIGSKMNVPVYDFAGSFPDDPALYVDAVHVNEKGARQSAELFAKLLLDGGLADKVHQTLADRAR